MSESLVKDRVIQRAVSSVPQRSEKQTDPDRLLATFVDPGISNQLDNVNNQILYGRRGTGKTHALKVITGGGEHEGQLSIYVDMRKLGSSSIYEDLGRSLSVRVSSLLKDVLAEVDSALLDFATDPVHELPGNGLEALHKLSQAITRTVIADADVEVESSSGQTTRESGSAEASVGLVPTVAMKIGGEEEQQSNERIRQSGKVLEKILFQEISSSLEDSLQGCGINRLLILLDEWTAIPIDLQPLLAEFLKRAMFPIAEVTVKIASLEYRSNFTEHVKKNNVIGFEVGSDISAALELDDYFVYDRNPERTIEMFSDLTYRHISAESDGVSGEPNYLESAHGIASPSDFIDGLFVSRDVFAELVRAGEGVARDFINIFSAAFFDSIRRDTSKIDRSAVQQAAREWYEKDKAMNVDETLGELLRVIVDEVIGERRARSFMLERRYEKSDVIQSLFDFRLLHLVQRGYADKDNPGTRYNIYTLDYGTYVDLAGTKKAPEGDFSEDLKDEVGVIVPFDDKRSIRRIILKPEHLAVASPD